MHFTDPFHVSTRVADKCNDGTLLLQVSFPPIPCHFCQFLLLKILFGGVKKLHLFKFNSCQIFRMPYTVFCVHLSFFFQVMLHSQVKASLTIYDAWLDLQDGFTHTGQGDGRPASGFFPLVISPTSRAGMLFSICLVTEVAEGMPISSLALCISYQSLIKLYKPSVMYLTMAWDVVLLDNLIWKFEASIVEMLHNAQSSFTYWFTYSWRCSNEFGLAKQSTLHFKFMEVETFTNLFSSRCAFLAYPILVFHSGKSNFLSKEAVRVSVSQSIPRFRMIRYVFPYKG